jgi:hypothetical protein
MPIMTLFPRFTATLSAAALALGVATTTPAAASNEAGYLFGGLVLGGLVGAAIANDSHRSRGGHHVSRGSDYRGDSYRGGHDRRVNLPGQCRVHSSHRSGYSGNCLYRYDYDHAALPSACAIRVGGHHGTIYRDNCLNQYGYY